MQRQAGIFANIAGDQTLGALSVTSVAGATAGASVVSVAGGQIGQSGGAATGLGMYYTTGNAAVELTYGADLPSGATWTPITGSPVTLTGQTAGNYVTVALVNLQTGKVIGGGNAALVVGA